LLSQDNPAKSIATEHWKGAYGKYKIGKKPTFTIIQEYFSSRSNIPEVPQSASLVLEVHIHGHITFSDYLKKERLS